VNHVAAKLTRQRPPRLLLADDNDLARQWLAEALRDAGFDVHEACDAGSCLAQAVVIRPDLVLLDLRMRGARDPGTVRGGEEALRKLKADPTTERIPIFIVSGEPDGRSAEALRRFGAAMYFQKPFDVQRLIGAIWDAI